MTNNNPFNFIPLQPTGRNETKTANTYYPDDMIKIYEQQFLTVVPEEQLTEFLPALKAFYDIDDHTLDISAVIFDAIADFCIIYNHKVKVGNYEILGDLVKEDIAQEYSEQEEGSEVEEAQAYTLDCKRTFFINEVELPYHFNLFIHGDSYSTLPKRDTLLEQIYWLVSDEFEADSLANPEGQESLVSINEQLADLDIRAMDMTTVHELVNYMEDSLMDDEMVEALNQLLDATEK